MAADSTDRMPIYDPLERARQAAEMGDAQAQLELGQMYYEGKKVPQDYAEAARLVPEIR